jgi:predicted MFS family arabinose efflux permease
VNPFAPLRDRDFRLFFTGEVLSFIGAGLSLVSLNWYLLDRTDSTTAVAVFYAVALGAGLVAFPLSGPIADRYARRAVAIAADLLRVASIGGLAVLAWFGDPPLLAIYISAFVTGLGFALFFPAIMGFLQEIVSGEQIVAASGLIEVTTQTGNLTGAAFAGVALQELGLAAVLTIDAATYALSALALFAVRHRSVPAGRYTPFADLLREGVGYLRANGALAVFGVVSLVPSVATISLNIVAVAYVQDVLGRGPVVYGITDMMYGAGAMLSGLLAAMVVIRVGERASLVGFMAVVAAGYGVFALLPRDLAVVFALSVLLGFCSSGFRVTANSVLLRVVPGAVMGRATAAFGLCSTVLQVTCATAIGPLIDHGGVRAGFLTLAVLVATALVALTTVLPRLHRAPEPA